MRVFNRQTIFLSAVISVSVIFCIYFFKDTKKQDPLATCHLNLMIIMETKISFGINNAKVITNNVPITFEQLAKYIKGGIKSEYLRCPSGGAYTIGCLGEWPVCSLHGNPKDSPMNETDISSEDTNCVGIVVQLGDAKELGLDGRGKIVRYDKMAETLPVMTGLTVSNLLVGSICQNEIVNICKLLRANNSKKDNQKLTIRDVRLKLKHNIIEIILQDGSVIEMQGKAEDFKVLWSMRSICLWLEHFVQVRYEKGDDYKHYYCPVPQRARLTDSNIESWSGKKGEGVRP